MNKTTLTKADKKSLIDAFLEVSESRADHMSKLGVVARAPEGSWPMSPGHAARKLAAIKNKNKALNAAILKLRLG